MNLTLFPLIFCCSLHNDGKKFSVSVIVVEEIKFLEFSITRLNLLALENLKLMRILFVKDKREIVKGIAFY